MIHEIVTIGKFFLQTYNKQNLIYSDKQYYFVTVTYLMINN